MIPFSLARPIQNNNGIIWSFSTSDRSAWSLLGNKERVPKTGDSLLIVLYVCLI